LPLHSTQSAEQADIAETIADPLRSGCAVLHTGNTRPGGPCDRLDTRGLLLDRVGVDKIHYDSFRRA